MSAIARGNEKRIKTQLVEECPTALRTTHKVFCKATTVVMSLWYISHHFQEKAVIHKTFQHEMRLGSTINLWR